jgi:hypothetical protein
MHKGIFTFTLLPSQWQDEFGKVKYSFEYMGSRNVKSQNGLQIRQDNADRKGGYNGSSSSSRIEPLEVVI